MNYKIGSIVKIVKVNEGRCACKASLSNYVGKEVEVIKSEPSDKLQPIKISLVDINGFDNCTWLYEDEFSNIDEFKVKCIDDDCSELEKNKEYTVISKFKTSLNMMYELKEYDDWCSSKRFIILNEEKNMLSDMISKYNKITHDELQCKYIYSDNGLIYNDLDEEYILTLHDVMTCNWKEYKEGYKTNFEFNKDDEFIVITSDGILRDFEYDGGGFDSEHMDAFNMFDDLKYAEYISKKNILQRKMETFAYLNNEKGKESKYYTTAYLYDDGRLFTSTEKRLNCKSTISATTFTSEELADECLRLYSKDIENVLKLKKELFNI